jgi:hypothetical protein
VLEPLLMFPNPIRTSVLELESVHAEVPPTQPIPSFKILNKFDSSSIFCLYFMKLNMAHSCAPNNSQASSCVYEKCSN